MHLWLRAETKPFERRTPLVPADAKRWLAAGHRLTVERSKDRIFPDAAYEQIGATLAPFGAWTEAPRDAVILGIKELPEDEWPLIHRHIYFAHAFKQQTGWRELLARFQAGGGILLDLEFLTDDKGRRVAAFGFWAGYAGCALGLDIWAHQRLYPLDWPYPSVHPFSDRQALVNHVKDHLQAVGAPPQTLVIGHRGRSGRGAMSAARDLGISATGWGLQETRGRGPIPEILDFDLMVNCILVQSPIKPFVTVALLQQPRQLSVVADVSCDPTGPYNPLPIYDRPTTFHHPVVRVMEPDDTHPMPLDVMAIDHLPSLLPKESSEDFSEQLLPHLLTLPAKGDAWERAEACYRQALSRI